MDATDSDYLDEVIIRLVAEVDHEAAERVERERQERAEARRREQRQRAQRSMGGGWAVEEAEIE